MNVNLEISMSKAYTIDFNASNRSLKDIGNEFVTVRDASISLFNSMTTEMLDFKDLPGEHVYSARSLG